MTSASEKYCKNIKVNYFKETVKFVFVCQQNDKYLLLIIKNSIFDINKNIYQTRIFPISKNECYFSVIYNKFTKDYSIIGNFNFTLKNTLRYLSSHNFSGNENHEILSESILIDMNFSPKFSSNKPYGNYKERKLDELTLSNSEDILTNDIT